MKTLVLALCFMAVFEGILPLVAPAKWKQAVKTAADLPDAVPHCCGAGGRRFGGSLADHALLEVTSLRRKKHKFS